MSSETVHENRVRSWGLRHEYKLGIVATVVAVLMFTSLVEVFLSNLNNQSAILLMPSITVLNGFLWCLYAYVRQDLFVFIPNVVAMVLGTLTVIAVYI